jgi:Protein of unknown function (DUF1579)
MRLAALLAGILAATAVAAQSPQTEEIKAMAGTWDVVMTFRPNPDAPATVAKDLLAERTMIGQYLQESMRPARQPAAPESDFRRISYLAYNRTDGRWEYSSIDTRVTGIMTRVNFGGALATGVPFYIQSFTLPIEFGDKLGGRALRLREEMRRTSADRDELLQYWTLPGGTEWLAVHYQYLRRR